MALALDCHSDPGVPADHSQRQSDHIILGKRRNSKEIQEQARSAGRGGWETTRFRRMLSLLDSNYLGLPAYSEASSTRAPLAKLVRLFELRDEFRGTVAAFAVNPETESRGLQIESRSLQS